MRRTATILIVVLFSIVPLWSHAFIGHMDLPGVGPLPCAIACGGDQGLINAGFPGDVVEGFVTGPSIDKFEQAGYRVVDKAVAAFDNRLTQFEERVTNERETFVTEIANQIKAFDSVLAQQREMGVAQLTTLSQQFVKDLDGSATQAIAELDGVLQGNLDRGDVILEQRLGNLHVIANRFVIDLGATLWQAAAAIGIVVFLGYLGWDVYKALRTGKPKRAIAIGGLRGLAGAIVVFLVAFIAVRASHWFQLRQYRKNLEQQYQIATSDMNFRYAAYWASQLRALDYRVAQYEAYELKAELLRDVFARPTLSRTYEGLREIQSRAKAAQSRLKDETGQLDPDIQVLLASVTWQAGRERLSEYVAANLAANAVTSHDSTEPDKPFPLESLAVHYIESYLLYPLSEEELELLGVARETSENFVWFNRNELRELVGRKRIYKDNPLSVYLNYGRAVRSLYRAVVPNYVQMILAHANARTSTGEEDRTAWADRRTSAATAVMNAWEDFLREIAKSEYEETSLRFAALGGLSATYVRAQQYLHAVQQPESLDAGPPPAVTIDGGVESRLLDLLRSRLNVTGYEVLKASEEAKFRVTQERLITIETELLDFVTTTNPYDVARQNGPQPDEAKVAEILRKAKSVAGHMSMVGLFVCGEETASLDCEADEDVRSAVLLLRSLAIGINPELRQFEDQVRLSQQRFSPIV